MPRQPVKTADTVDKEESFMFKSIDEKAAPADKRSLPKEFVVEREDHGLYIIKLTAGGEVPDVLKGKWTNLMRARGAVDNYVTTREQQQGGAVASSSAS